MSCTTEITYDEQIGKLLCKMVAAECIGRANKADSLLYDIQIALIKKWYPICGGGTRAFSTSYYVPQQGSTTPILRTRQKTLTWGYTDNGEAPLNPGDLLTIPSNIVVSMGYSAARNGLTAVEGINFSINWATMKITPIPDWYNSGGGSGSESFVFTYFETY